MSIKVNAPQMLVSRLQGASLGGSCEVPFYGPLSLSLQDPRFQPRRQLGLTSAASEGFHSAWPASSRAIPYSWVGERFCLLGPCLPFHYYQVLYEKVPVNSSHK